MNADVTATQGFGPFPTVEPAELTGRGDGRNQRAVDVVERDIERDDVVPQRRTSDWISGHMSGADDARQSDEVRGDRVALQ
jgi:hypothetical protein